MHEKCLGLPVKRQREAKTEIANASRRAKFEANMFPTMCSYLHVESIGSTSLSQPTHMRYPKSCFELCPMYSVLSQFRVRPQQRVRITRKRRNQILMPKIVCVRANTRIQRQCKHDLRTCVHVGA